MFDKLSGVDEAAETVLDLFKRKETKSPVILIIQSWILMVRTHDPMFPHVLHYANFSPRDCRVHSYLFEWLVAQACVR
jgi:hypothetical protein